jgi:N-acetylglutamate synthase
VITTMEELSLNAWPAHQTLLYDGWVLRFANGYTKRANSINPLYTSTLDLEEKIDFCENTYRQQKLEVVFKLTSAACPATLEYVLSARGFRKDSQTSLQVLELGSSGAELAHGAMLGETISDSWLDAFCRMSAVDERERENPCCKSCSILSRAAAMYLSRSMIR